MVKFLKYKFNNKLLCGETVTLHGKGFSSWSL